VASARGAVGPSNIRNPIMPQSPPRHVFVYGTLRRGQANDITRLKPTPRFIGPARIAAVLYDLGRYPGAVLGGASTIVGEVYAIEPELEQTLDRIEEVYPQQTDEYFKRMLDVEVAGAVRDCIVYEINPRYIVGAARIDSGDWVSKDRRGLET
jgi:gamma-glutamylcyclotransferase (GGCT)/AIG2-like uncharacterized protein YtfP